MLLDLADEQFQRDWEDFQFLNELFQKGVVNYIEDSNFLFKKIIEKFPIQSHRINWNLFEHSSIHIEGNYPENKETIQAAVLEIFVRENIDMNKVVFIGFDGYTKGALSMPLNIFIEQASEILTYPQHSYIIPEDGSWCMQYSMEHFIDFGYAARSA